MDIDAYLQRIGYAGPRQPTAGTLRALHHAHLLAVPFENLDIGLKRPIVLDEAAIFDKVVRRRRGGFCYELNGLFAALLRALGFEVTLLSARVYSGGQLGPEFDHLALLVHAPGPWLADVGFGDSFVTPLHLCAGVEQPEPGRATRYRLVQATGAWEMHERQRDGDWVPGYQFTLQPRDLADFAAMCHYHQTSPHSSFTQKRVCSRATPHGRITISNDRLIITVNGERQEQALASEAEWSAALKQHFGIQLGGQRAEP